MDDKKNTHENQAEKKQLVEQDIINKLVDECSEGKTGVIAKFAVAVLVFFIVVILDVFGIDEQTGKISRDYASRFLSTIHSVHDVDDSLVILIEDDYLEKIGGWPPSFDDYKRLVQRVEAGSPSSITLDILFSNKLDKNLNAGAERFKQLIHSPPNDTPIYLAFDPEAKEIYDLYLEDQSNQVAISWRDNDDYYPKFGLNGGVTAAFKIYQDSFGKLESTEEILPIWPKSTQLCFFHC